MFRWLLNTNLNSVTPDNIVNKDSNTAAVFLCLVLFFSITISFVVIINTILKKWSNKNK